MNQHEGERPQPPSAVRVRTHGHSWGEAITHAHSTHVASLTHAHSMHQTHLESCSAPWSWEGQHPLHHVSELHWLPLLLHLCHKTLGPWSPEQRRDRATQASLPPHAPAAQQVALPQSCPPVTSFNHSTSMATAAEPADPMPTPLLTGMLSHPPIPITDMAEHMERLKANDSLKLSQEYEVS